MEKNKLTDEEIVKALACCVKGESCVPCPYFIKKIDCVYKRRAEGDALDLINRLQNENERLTEEKYKVEQNLKQCENGYELELHTERYKNAELQKQVDELTDKLGKVLSTVGIDEYQQSKAIEQAVKDTAKEILQEIVKLRKEEHGIYYSAYDYAIEIGKRVRKKYGVEVE